MKARVALLAPALVLAAGLVPAPVHGGDPAAAAVRTVVRSYGGPPVRQQGPDQVVRIRFRGHAGDRVLLRDSGRLTRLAHGSARLTSDGVPVRHHGYTGWTLPRDGWQVFTFRPREHLRKPARVQLVKVLPRRLDVDGPARGLRPRRGILYLASVRVPRAGSALLATRSDRTGELLGPHTFRAVEPGRGSVLLGPGLPVFDGTDFAGRPAVARQRYRLLTEGGRTTVRSTSTTSGTYDGPATAFVNGTTAEPRATEIAFTGSAGAWFDPVVPGGATAYGLLLVGPDGKAVPRTPLAGLWRLRGTGLHRLLVVPLQMTYGAAGSAALDGLDVLAPLAVDGPPVRFVPTRPGRGVLAPVGPTAATAVRLSASNATLTGDWRAWIGLDHDPCDPRGPLGCGDYVLAGVDPTHPVSWFVFTGGFVYLPDPPGQSGSVDLQVLSH
jgi:hypothetical protein